MYRTTLLCLPLLALTLLAGPADAQDDRWQFRAGGIWLNPDVSFTDVNSDGDRVQAGADSGIGFGLAIERRFSSRLGLELGALFAEPDVTLDTNLADGTRFSASDGIPFRALTAGLNIHLTPGKKADLYVGPLLSYIQFGDVGFRTQVAGQTIAQDFSSNDDFAIGAQVGADISIGGGPWSLNLVAKYLDTALEVTDDEGEVTKLGFDPLILKVGFGYRF